MTNLKKDSFVAYKFLSGTRLSPHGKWCTYHVHQSNLDDNRYDSDLWALNLETGKNKRLTTSKRVATHIWLPGADMRVMYPSTKDSAVKKTIESGEPLTVYYVLNMDGGESEEYMRLPLSVSDIRAIDADHFVLKAGYHPKLAELASLDDAEKKARLETLKEEKDYEVIDEIPFWMNGGSYISQAREMLFLYDRTLEKLEPITRPDVSVEFFDFDEKRNKVLYTIAEMRGKMPLETKLFVYSIESGVHENLTEGGGEVNFAAYRDDGKILMLFNNMAQFGLNQNGTFFLLDPETKDLEPFAFGFSGTVGNSVGSDCRYGGKRAMKMSDNALYFISTEEHEAKLVKLDASGELMDLTAEGTTIDDFDVMGDRVMAILMQGLELEELYEIALGRPASRKTEHNVWVGETFYRSEPEPVSFTNLYGDEIDGWVLKPVNYESGKSYPAILDIHGGPKTVYGTVFYHEMQYWANEGFFVFFCNPTGSDGRGDTFSDIRGRYGTVDYDDIMGFADTVLSMYSDIDTEKVFVTGGSYGGFMTNWIIGHTNRFRAAASQRSISNWTTEFGVTDIGYFFVTDQMGADPWTDYEKLWTASPLKYADRVETPTLFIHSDQDYRCGIAEAYQMFTALKYFGVETRLCLFKGENHELSRGGKPKHRIRRLQEITDWFKKFL